MSKRPTPKKKTARSASSSRYRTYQGKTRKRLVAMTKITKCPQCNEDQLAHTACQTCGNYKGRSVIDKNKEMDKITKVKA